MTEPAPPRGDEPHATAWSFAASWPAPPRGDEPEASSDSISS